MEIRDLSYAQYVTEPKDRVLIIEDVAGNERAVKCGDPDALEKALRNRWWDFGAPLHTVDGGWIACGLVVNCRGS